MEKANTLALYWLGSALGELKGELRSSPTFESFFRVSVVLSDYIHIFMNRFDALPLSSEAADHINGALASWYHDKTEDSSCKGDEILTSEELESIKQAIEKFESLLESELPRANIFYATPKLAYDVSLLINKGESLLPAEALNGLSQAKDKVVNDIREAAKCVAFNIPTAAGFHIFRAIEAVVVDEYFPFYHLASKSRNLGAYTKALKEVPIDTKVTNMLDYVREEFRNPISHPDQLWTQGEAMVALGLAVSAITMMAQDIARTRKTGI